MHRNSISDWIRRKGSENTLLGHSIQLCYLCFSHHCAPVTVSLFGIFVIPNLIEQGYRGPWFWFCSGTFIVANYLIAWANQHVKGKIRDTATFQRTLWGLGKTMRAMSVTLQKYFAELMKTGAVNGKHDAVDFQQAAFLACEGLKERLLPESAFSDDSSRERSNSIYITVYQKDSDEKRAYCRMIAFSSHLEPGSYGQKYYLESTPQALKMCRRVWGR